MVVFFVESLINRVAMTPCHHARTFQPGKYYQQETNNFNKTAAYISTTVPCATNTVIGAFVYRVYILIFESFPVLPWRRAAVPPCIRAAVPPCGRAAVSPCRHTITRSCWHYISISYMTSSQIASYTVSYKTNILSYC